MYNGHGLNSSRDPLYNAGGMTSNYLALYTHTEKKNIIHNDGPSQMTTHIKTIMAYVIAGERHKRLNAFSQNVFCRKPSVAPNALLTQL